MGAKVAEGRLVRVAFGPFSALFDGTELAVFKAGGADVRVSQGPHRFLAYLVRHPDCWVAKRDVFLALYGDRPPGERPEPKILDVYCTMARNAIAKALATPLPERSHYLVSDHRGKIGLFAAPQPMGYARGPRGKVNGTLRELYRLLEPPPKPPEPRFA